MKEYDLPIKEAFTRGLCPETRMGRGFGRMFLSSCVGLKPLEVGLRRTDGLRSPFGTTPFAAWPLPQIAVERDTVLLLSDSTFREIDTEPYYWRIGDFVPMVEATDLEADAQLETNGNGWHFTEGLNGGVYTNGVNVVVRDNSEALYAQRIVTKVHRVAVGSVASHNGRIFYGGFDPATLWSSDWEAMFEEWLLKSPVWVDYAGQQAVDRSYVFWSAVASGGSWPISQPDPKTWMELFERGDAGFAPMPWKGSVLRVLPLGSGVMVYGDKGIAFLRPMTSPVVGFGVIPLSRVGIAGRSAAGGNAYGHLFVAADGQLWTVGHELQLSRKDYRAQMNEGRGSQYVVSLDEREGEFYIGYSDGGSAHGYVLTSQGLGQSTQVPTGVVSFHDDDSYSVLATNSDTYYEAVTEVMDFKGRDLKTITMVEVGAEASANQEIEVAVDYRYENEGSWARSPWIEVNPEGFARVQVTAIEFRVAVRSLIANNDGFQLDYLNVKWQAPGRRAIRGLTSADEAVA